MADEYYLQIKGMQTYNTNVTDDKVSTLHIPLFRENDIHWGRNDHMLKRILNEYYNNNLAY